IAASELNTKYECKVKVVDSLSASMGEGMLVYKLALQKKSGMDFEAASKWAEDHRLKICHLFTVDDLNHLSKSGRLSKTSAFFGSMLNIKPVLHVDDEGRLVAIDKARGRHKSIEMIAEKMKEYSSSVDNDVIFISHGDCLSDAKELADKIKQKTGMSNFIFGNITPMIGTHTGLGTLALFFESNKR
ncbi:MAG: DegV family protein, partial [Clostridia bacterium]|nr:DegV family protein [Clostridia bacterium]